MYFSFILKIYIWKNFIYKIYILKTKNQILEYFF